MGQGAGCATGHGQHCSSHLEEHGLPVCRLARRAGALLGSGHRHGPHHWTGRNRRLRHRRQSLALRQHHRGLRPRHMAYPRDCTGPQPLRWLRPRKNSRRIHARHPACPQCGRGHPDGPACHRGSLNGKAIGRPGVDDCLACHRPHPRCRQCVRKRGLQRV